MRSSIVSYVKAIWDHVILQFRSGPRPGRTESRLAEVRPRVLSSATPNSLKLGAAQAPTPAGWVRKTCRYGPGTLTGPTPEGGPDTGYHSGARAVPPSEHQCECHIRKLLGRRWAGAGTDLKHPSAMCLFQSTLNFGDLSRLVHCVTTVPCSHCPTDGH